MTLNPFSRLGAAWRDLRFFFATRERHEYWFALLSVAITAFIIFAFWHDSNFTPAPQIVYVNNWPANRTDAEIIKEQKIDTAARHKAEAERRAEFQKLADQLGIDTKH